MTSSTTAVIKTVNIDLKPFLVLRILDLNEVEPLPVNSLNNEDALEQHLVEVGAGIKDEFLWVLAYQSNAVIWGCLTASGLQIAPNGGQQIKQRLEPLFLQELRLFGPKGEYYLWRDKKGFRSRLRLDNGEVPAFQGPEREGYSPNLALVKPNVAEEWQVLWGTSYKINQPGWSEVYEDRGARLIIPHTLEDATPLPLRLLVRHYLAYDTTGLCFYKDLRLVELRDCALNPLSR